MIMISMMAEEEVIVSRVVSKRRPCRLPGPAASVEAHAPPPRRWRVLQHPTCHAAWCGQAPCAGAVQMLTQLPGA